VRTAPISPSESSNRGHRLRSILQHLAAEEGVELEVVIEIHARRPGGFSEERIRTVNENARVLNFEQFGFQNE
jgi:hypothetical protein